MKILLINTSDVGGGAEKNSFDLHNAYIHKGLDSILALGFVKNRGINTFPINDYPVENIKLPLNKLLRYALRLSRLDWPAFLRWVGFEDIYYPKTKRFHLLVPKSPEIIHAHNLHGGYFNLNSLINISKNYPLLITMHDEWLLTGHCAYTINCNRWQSGCGSCPDLVRYPGIKHDRTKLNYKIKNRIFNNSVLSFATPSNWLMKQLEKRNIFPLSKKVIPNGINQEIFHSSNRLYSKAKLGFQPDDILVLYIAAKGQNNPYKDYHTIIAAIEILSTIISSNICFICIGGDLSNDRFFKNVRIIELPFIKESSVISDYYRAADIFLHAAKADNFPTTIIESLSCGTPVIATNIGGISEQIIDGETGFLIQPNDPFSIAKKIELLITHPQMLKVISENASTNAKERFSLELMTSRYLDFYSEVIETWKKKSENDK
jgi:glycosyltransferase involved in cell wall biosynthesis